jgi:hypothetical protein
MLGASPLLFALDRELGVNGGNVYDAGAMARLEAKRLPWAGHASAGGCAGVSFAGSSAAGCDAGHAGGCDAGGASCGGGGSS